jgi:hypothetical protein
MIFDFGFSKKFDLSLLSTLGWVIDRCQVFDLFASADAQSSTFHSFRPGQADFKHSNYLQVSMLTTACFPSPSNRFSSNTCMVVI